MSEWENNENERPEGEMQPGPTPNEPGNSPNEQPQPEPTGQPAGNGSDYYTWEGKPGKKGKKHRRSNRTGVFCAVAVVCLVLTAAICLPTLLFLFSDDGSALPSENSWGSGAGTQSGTTLSPEETVSYDVSQTIEPNTDPENESTDLTELYETCSKSCVSIYVTFGRQYEGSYAIGSGFVLTDDGYIATNQHVVDEGEKIKVIFYDGTEYDAELVGEDGTGDLAVLKIDATDLTPLQVGNSDALKVGQSVAAIGTPYDMSFAGTLTCGSISGLNRQIQVTDDETGAPVKTLSMIQTDASINPGNSGGPLINMSGEVVGINAMKLMQDSYDSTTYEGLGFAIPINYAVDIFNQLIQYGRVVRQPDNSYVSVNAKLHITVTDVEFGVEEYRLSPTCDYPKEGALVVEVEPNSAVYKAGLQLYDIITEFDGRKITSKDDLTSILGEHRAGDQVSITVYTFSRQFDNCEQRTLTFVLDGAA